MNRKYNLVKMFKTSTMPVKVRDAFNEHMGVFSCWVVPYEVGESGLDVLDNWFMVKGRALEDELIYVECDLVE